MRIRRVHIKGFRCLKNVEVYFDDVTTFVGHNGVGKSSILRALDWFFNGPKSVGLTDADVFSGLSEKDRTVSVEVEFDSLTKRDREVLGKYASNSTETVKVIRTWRSDFDKLTGTALSYPPFDKVREGLGAAERRSRYADLKKNQPELNLPSASSGSAVEEAMLAWEQDHTDQLEEVSVDVTDFYSNTGQGKLHDLFDFIFVAADLRASEEVQDAKAAVIGRILEQAVDRTAADKELADLASETSAKQSTIQNKYFKKELEDISKQLTQAVESFTAGRTVKVFSQEQVSRPPRVQFNVGIVDQTTETTIDRQGHGFQRAMLISALRLLAERSVIVGSSRVICLAIEEPELFQHPVQAKAFDTVLRTLTESKDRGIQITYATHSPYFVNPHRFNEIRRVSRATKSKTAEQIVSVSSASIDDIVKLLDGFIDRAKIQRQMAGTAVNKLQDAFFSPAVVLVEGETDAAIVDGVAARDEPLYLKGISIASVGGRDNFLLPWAILESLHIPCYVVVDGDAGCETRMTRDGKNEVQIRDAKQNIAASNRQLLRRFGITETDWPATQTTKSLTVFNDTIESLLTSDWPEWMAKHDELIGASAGLGKKHAVIYRAATRLAAAEPPKALVDAVEAIRKLAPS